MTQLCIDSISQLYTDITDIYVLVDDLSTGAWPNYQQDCQELYAQNIRAQVNCIPYSSLLGIDRCKVGWWRAQLIKLHIDCVVPGESWLVVDGDVIFDQYIDPRYITPYSTRYGENPVIDSMVTRYVEVMLGKQGTRLMDVLNRRVITSSVPFRYLERSQLQNLRQHVENQIHGDVLTRHCEMFENQDIVGFVPEGDRMVMHEWELIEAYNHMATPERYQAIETGSGYHTLTHTALLEMGWIFRHSSLNDVELGRDWFKNQNLIITDAQWQRSQEFSKHHA